MKDPGGFRIDRPRRAAVDIRLMSAVTGKSDEPAVDKGWLKDRPVGQMVAAGDIRVVGEKDVAVVDVVGEGLEQGAHGKAAVAALDQHTVSLADERAFGVGDEIREIVVLAEDRAVRRAQHDLAHAPRDIVETVLGQRKDDRIGLHYSHPLINSG